MFVVAARRGRKFRLNAPVIVFLICGWGLFIGLGISAVKFLRPISDDYWLAVVGAGGIFELPLYLFQNWSGDIGATFFQGILLATPLVVLPYGAGSAVAFISSLVILSILTLSLIKKSGAVTPKDSRIFYAIFLPVIAVLWISFWWIDGQSGIDQPDALGRSMAIIHWQTTNVAYVFVPAFLVLMFLLLLKLRSKLLQTLGFSLFGIFTGLCTYFVATTAIILAMLSGLFALISHARRQEAAEKKLYIVFIIGALAGMAFSYFSPGARLRAETLTSTTGMQISVKNLLKLNLFDGITEWVGSICSLAFLLVIAGGLALAFISSLLGFELKSGRLLITVTQLLSASLVLFSLLPVIDGITYPAFWHSILGMLFLFLAGLLFGIYLQTEWIKFSPNIFLLTIYLAVVLVVIVANIQSVVEMRHRSLIWEQGAAPIKLSETLQIADRNHQPWNEYWQKLESIKSARKL